ncbi:lactonase family protein [Streptomyces capparidis]
MVDGQGDGRIRAYIGSFTSAGGDGITVAAVDEATGKLHRTGSVRAPDPSFLALSGDGRVLYAVSEARDGAALAYDLTDPDRPRPLGHRPVRGAHPTHLAPAADGRVLLTANYGSGSVSALPVLDGAGLGKVADVLRHRGSGPVKERQEGPHAHQVVPDPSGRWILAVDLGTDCVYVYRLGLDPVALRPHTNLKVRGGLGPRHLAFHPGGRVAYLVNELTPALTVCRWDTEEGRLAPVGEAPLAPPDAPGPDYPSNAVVRPDGRFVYAASRGGNTLAVLAADPTGEELEPVTAVDCGGDWPRHLAADPSGRRLYVANERSGEVAWFDLDPETGVPAHAGTLKAPAASCVVFRRA